MIYLYLAHMEGLPTGATRGTITEEYFFPDVHAFFPVNVADPEFVVREEDFALDAHLFLLC